jgi:hypothetical protein
MRSGLILPASSDAAATLSRGYVNDELGALHVHRSDSKGDFPISAVVDRSGYSQRSPGRASFVTIHPGVAGLEFIPGKHHSKPALTIREGQIEYLSSAN